MDPEPKDSKALRAKSASQAEQLLKNLEQYIALKAILAETRIMHPLGNSAEDWWGRVVEVLGEEDSSVGEASEDDESKTWQDGYEAGGVAMLVAMQEWAL